MDTIFALASARGKSGVAVIRVSGPRAFEACSRLAGTCPPLRVAGLRKLRGADGGILDEALVLCFGAGASFTGEDVVEFHTHGGRGVTAAVLDRLSGIEGLRLAEPGEFTRRAFTNGCLDLSQVEGLADLIEAETEAQRRLAVRGLGGETSRKIERWRGWLLRAIALVEATIDFADEEVPEDVWPEVTELLGSFEGEAQRDLAAGQMAQQVRDGFEVAIVGAPNVGKSTLLNALAGRDAALTSEIAGTTRDVIEVRMEIGGLLVLLLDTAGIREAEDVIEAAGVALARNRASAADLRVFLSEDGKVPEGIAFQEGDILARAKCDSRLGLRERCFWFDRPWCRLAAE